MTESVLVPPSTLSLHKYSPYAPPPHCLQAAVGETTIDPSAVLLRQNIELTNVPVGTCRVVFDRIDFGNFLVHPLMTAAAAEAVQVS